MRYKICSWLNVPSNHQTLFLDALNQDERIDLRVRYFSTPSQDHLDMGWRDENSLREYAQYVYSFDGALKTLVDWKERIHIVMGYSYPFNRKLIPIFIKNQVKWVHWSERYGIGAGNRNKLAKAMQNCISCKELLSQHGNYSKKLFEDFTPEKNVERFVASIEKWLKIKKV